MKLHLGVFDKTRDDGKTTADVAELLEAKYHIIELFVETRGMEMITDALTDSVQTALEDLVSGGTSSNLDATFAGAEKIRDEFKVFINRQELDGVVPGVPTFASTGGYVDVKVKDKNGNVKIKRRKRGAVNHRLAKPYAVDNAPRPSFRDTSDYEDSFWVWIDD